MAAKSDKKRSEAGKRPRSEAAVKERPASKQPEEGGADEDAADEPPADEPRGPGGLVIPEANLIGTSPVAPPAEEAEGGPTELGVGRYVQAAFFAGGLLAAFVAGKILLTTWNRLAEWPAAVRAVPRLLSAGEGERGTYTMIVGVLIGIAVTVYTYRKEEVRQWANDTALELSKVTWPNREMVTNGTIVVIAASVVATLYIMLLDRFWSFLTKLIYET